MKITGALRLQGQSHLYCFNNALDVSGAAMEIGEGSAVVMDRGELLADGAGIRISDGSSLILPYYVPFSVQDMSLEVSSYGGMSIPTPFELKNSTVTLNEGSLRITGREGTLTDCAVTVAENGDLVFDSVALSLRGQTEIVNNGHVYMSGDGEYKGMYDFSVTAEDTVRIVNNGRMELCDTGLPVSGRSPEYE